MDRSWHIDGAGGPIRLVYTPLRRRADGLAPEQAVFRSFTWFSDGSAGRHVLYDIVAALGESTVRPPDVAVARERVQEALKRGDLVAVPIVEQLASSVAEAAPEAKTKKQDEKHFIEFEFTYPDGSPVKDLPYRFVYPDGHDENGTLGGDGLIAKNDVRPGGYAVFIKEVEAVRWERTRILCDDEVKIRAQVSGFPPGAAAKVLVYREHEEEPGSEVAKLDGSVKDDVVEVTFKYDYQKDDERKREEGIVRFIAEVSFEGGKYWGKTPSAVEVELPTITTARWSTAYAEDGAELELGVTVLGVADGTKAKFDVYRFHEKGDSDDKVKTLDAEVSGGRVKGACTYANGGEGDLTREGEYYFEVTIDAGAQRKARSGLLWCTDAA
jgi:hypothetical protein